MISTQKIFETDAYLKSNKSKIVHIEENCLVLEATLFAPTAGGQECDFGTIDGVPLTNVFEKDHVIYHQMASFPKTFQIGKQVHLELDWARRFDHMQNHCGEHILSGLLFEKYHAQNKGFHLGSEYSTLDVDFKNMSKDMIFQLESLANQRVYENRPIEIVKIEDKETALKLSLRKELKAEEDILIVTIDGVDCVACCCPHPKTTSEVGLIKIIKSESYKGMTRIYFKCGLRALQDYQKKHDIIATLNEKYSATEDTLLENIKIQDAKINKVRQDAHHTKIELFKIRAEELLAQFPDKAQSTFILGIYKDLGLEDLKSIARLTLEKSEKLLILCSLCENTVILTHSGKSGANCGQLVKDFASGFGGKGGGNQTFAQALFSKPDVMENFIDIVKASIK